MVFIQTYFFLSLFWTSVQTSALFCFLFYFLQLHYLNWFIVSILKFLFQLSKKFSETPNPYSPNSLLHFPSIYLLILHIYIIIPIGSVLLLIYFSSLFSSKAYILWMNPEILLESLLNIGGLATSTLDLVLSSVFATSTSSSSSVSSLITNNIYNITIYPACCLIWSNIWSKELCWLML